MTIKYTSTVIDGNGKETVKVASTSDKAYSKFIESFWNIFTLSPTAIIQPINGEWTKEKQEAVKVRNESKMKAIQSLREWNEKKRKDTIISQDDTTYYPSRLQVSIACSICANETDDSEVLKERAIIQAKIDELESQLDELLTVKGKYKKNVLHITRKPRSTKTDDNDEEKDSSDL